MNCVSAAVSCRGHLVKWEIEIQNKSALGIGTRIEINIFLSLFPIFYIINTIPYLLTLVNIIVIVYGWYFFKCI